MLDCRMLILQPRGTIKDLSLITVLTALCVGGSYALIGIPNVNVMDVVVFVTGFAFGIPIGVSVGVLTWAVYGAINPLGYSLPIWITTMLTQSLFGLTGGLVGRGTPSSMKGHFSLEMGLWGLLLTIIYDLITNLAFAAVFNVPVLAAIVSGWLIPPWFGILHEVSNFLLFSLAVYPLTRAIQTMRGGDKLWVNEPGF